MCIRDRANIKKGVVITGVFISGVIFGMGTKDQNVVSAKNMCGASLPITIPGVQSPGVQSRKSSLSRSDSSISPHGTPASPTEMAHIQQIVNKRCV